MSTVAGASAQAKKPAYKASDIEDIRHNIDDLGSSVGEMATNQYERAHDAVMDGFLQTGDGHPEKPADRHRHWRGLGLPVRPCNWRPQQAGVSALAMNPLFQGRLPCCALRNSNDAVRFRHSGRAATKSTSNERPA